MIYLDNAATSWPKPESVYQAMDTFLRNKGGNPSRGSHSLALAAQETVEEARTLVARFFNCPERARVIFTLNCTDSLNLGLKGLLRPGDQVITSCIGHNSVARPLRKLERQGVSVTRVPPSGDTGFMSPEDVERAVTGSTRLLLVTHASNVNGVVQPIEEYGALARRRGLVFMVDAAQSAGKFPLDVQAAKIDLLACSGHKGLLGPPGTGVLYVGERVDLDTLREGGTGSQSELEEQPTALPFRFECGTVNSVGLAGLGAGVKFILGEGLDRIQAHEEELTHRLMVGLSQIAGVTLYTARTGRPQAPVVSFNLAGSEPGEVGVLLDQAFDIKVRTGLHCAPAAHRTLGTFPLGTVRLSPGYFNTVEDVDRTLEAVAAVAGMKQVDSARAERKAASAVQGHPCTKAT